jgi:hypothetical protein
LLAAYGDGRLPVGDGETQSLEPFDLVTELAVKQVDLTVDRGRLRGHNERLRDTGESVCDAAVLETLGQTITTRGHPFGEVAHQTGYTQSVADLTAQEIVAAGDTGGDVMVRREV